MQEFMLPMAAAILDRNFAWNFLITETGDAESVTFNTDGGSAIACQYFEKDESYTVIKPEDPTKDGSDFAGWYTSSDYTTLFDFNAPVYENTVIYARFVLEGDQTIVNISIVNNIVHYQAAIHNEYNNRRKVRSISIFEFYAVNKQRHQSYIRKFVAVF
jgi:uncharacterized repeat protein (TIGR02543 family)